MLPALVADGRTEEAKKMLKKIRSLEKPELLFVFDALVLRREGKIKEAEELLNDMLDKFADSWYTWSIIADFKADDCNYDEAVFCYEKSFELQEKPRYTDSLEAIAHIYEIKGMHQKSIETYKRIIELLSTDWNVTFGATVNKYLQKIDELTSK